MILSIDVMRPVGFLKAYIDDFLPNEKVIILGDLMTCLQMTL